jgi:hypothetical protein
MNPLMQTGLTMGGGLAGGGLGSLLDAPRRGVGSLLLALTGGRVQSGPPVPSPAPDDSELAELMASGGGGSWSGTAEDDSGGGSWGPPSPKMVPTAGGSLLPTILGGAAAGLTALSPFKMMTPWAFAAGTGLGQMINERINPGSSGSWRPDTGSGVGDFLAGAAMDPLAWAGMASGAMAGRVRPAGRPPSAMAVQAPPRPTGAPLTSAAPPARPDLSGLVRPDSAAQELARQAAPAAAAAEAAAPAAWTPELQAQFSGTGMVPEMGGLAGAAKSYKRVNPAVAPALEGMGMMPSPGNFPAGLPNWAQMRGGSVVPTPEQEMLINKLNDLVGASPNPIGDLRRRINFLAGGQPTDLSRMVPGPELLRAIALRQRAQGLVG